MKELLLEICRYQSFFLVIWRSFAVHSINMLLKLSLMLLGEFLEIFVILHHIWINLFFKILVIIAVIKVLFFHVFLIKSLSKVQLRELHFLLIQKTSSKFRYSIDLLTQCEIVNNRVAFFQKLLIILHDGRLENITLWIVPRLALHDSLINLV